MKKKILITILLMVTTIVLVRINSLAVAEVTANSQQINAWLDRKLTEWKTENYKPMGFASYHLFASDDMFIKSNAGIDTKFLEVLEDTGADIIVLYIRPQNYFLQKERYDSLLNKIRSDGKKLFIGARFEDKSMTFAEYDIALTEYTKNIIGTLKPDYYGIVIEPTTMQKKHGFNASPKEWIALTEKISELSKELNANTKTVIAGHKEELKFLALASSINDLDIVAFNIYGASGIYPKYEGYLGKGDVVGRTIDYANQKGKETWILETWVADIAAEDKKLLGTQEAMKPIDAKWVRLITYYAQLHEVKVVAPFFSGKFVYYGTNPTAFKSALDNGQRTPVFYAYKDVISEVKDARHVDKF